MDWTVLNYGFFKYIDNAVIKIWDFCLFAIYLLILKIKNLILNQ